MSSPKEKMPRGRPPLGGQLVNGKWELTEDSLARAAERLEKHRRDCRERYRRTQEALMAQRPDLFRKRRGHDQTIFVEKPEGA